MKNIIVLQHIKIEDPGYIKDLMLEDKVHIKTVELDEGEKIPDDIYVRATNPEGEVEMVQDPFSLLIQIEEKPDNWEK